MKKFSKILDALKILGPERILKLSEILNKGQVAMKRVSGDSFGNWGGDEAPGPVSPKRSTKEAKVLPFKKDSQYEALIQPPPEPPKEEESSNIISSDFMLWQREMARSTEHLGHKKDAVQGYAKSTEMYVVKTPTVDGKEKIRFASTNGVLVNKKQA